jgi:AraC-like DNA-binding protein
VKLDAGPSDFRLLRFQSVSFAPSQRAAVWQDILSRKLVAVEVEQLTNHPYNIDASLRILPECRFGFAVSGASTFRRTPAAVAKDNDDVLLVVSMEGSCTFANGDGETTLEEGDGYLLSCKTAGSFTWTANTRFMCLRLSRERLKPLVPNVAAAAGKLNRQDTEALRMLTSYLRTLDDGQTLATPELRKLVEAQIYDLAALAINARAARLLPNRLEGMGAIWPAAIKKYIRENLTHQSLSVSDVARVHRISSRHLQRVLEAEGTTFSEFLMACRLERTHAMLSDRRQAHRPVGEIALANGFGDISHFNRAFRRHYGASPTEIRKSTLLRSIASQAG